MINPRDFANNLYKAANAALILTSLEDFTAVKVKYGEKLKLLNTIVQILTTIAGQVY